MDSWVWAILLLAVGMGLVVLDIFVPSGGIFAFVAVGAILAAVWLAFSYNSLAGVLVLGGAVVGTIAAVALALKYWPSTAIGKKMLLDVPSGNDVLPENNPRKTLEALVGRIGTAKSPMLPNGMVMIDGLTVDAISEGLPVEAGQRVRVVEIRGNRVVVRGLPNVTDSQPDQDPLAQPVDWNDSDPFRSSEA